jgi:hypothetical protein
VREVSDFSFEVDPEEGAAAADRSGRAQGKEAQPAEESSEPEALKVRCPACSALRSARSPVNLIGCPINYANRLIGSPITSQSTARLCTMPRLRAMPAWCAMICLCALPRLCACCGGAQGARSGLRRHWQYVFASVS